MARPANEFLTLYRRHLASCTVPKKKVSPARKRTADCGCPIWIYGRTPHGTFYPRQTTGETYWQKAEDVRSRLMAGQPVGAQSAEAGITIADAIAKYIESRQHELCEKTVGHHRFSLGRLADFARNRGAKRMADLTVDLLEDFKTAGLPADMAGTTKSKAVEKVRCFLKEAYRRGWLERPIVEKLKPYRARYEQKEPYTDDEVNKILAGALKLNGGTHGYAKHPQTFRLLLELMVDTGMRVGDAIRYDPGATSKDGAVWAYTYRPQKAKRSERIKTIEAFIPDRLKRAIDECQWLSPKLPFYYGAAKNPAYLAKMVTCRRRPTGESPMQITPSSLAKIRMMVRRERPQRAARSLGR